MILVIASMGTERIAPGIPHIQNQKTSEMMTRTGLRVKRLARSIGVTVSPSTKCNPTYNPAGSSACQSGSAVNGRSRFQDRCRVPRDRFLEERLELGGGKTAAGAIRPQRSGRSHG